MGEFCSLKMNAGAGAHCARHLAEWKSFVCDCAIAEAGGGMRAFRDLRFLHIKNCQ
jgi:hypothetical protein